MYSKRAVQQQTIVRLGNSLECLLQTFQRVTQSDK